MGFLEAPKVLVGLWRGHDTEIPDVIPALQELTKGQERHTQIPSRDTIQGHSETATHRRHSLPEMAVRSPAC